MAILSMGYPHKSRCSRGNRVVIDGGPNSSRTSGVLVVPTTNLVVLASVSRLGLDRLHFAVGPEHDRIGFAAGGAVPPAKYSRL